MLKMKQVWLLFCFCLILLGWIEVHLPPVTRFFLGEIREGVILTAHKWVIYYILGVNIQLFEKKALI